MIDFLCAIGVTANDVLAVSLFLYGVGMVKLYEFMEGK
jgi:hypothetical protein